MKTVKVRMLDYIALLFMRNAMYWMRVAAFFMKIAVNAETRSEVDK